MSGFFHILDSDNEDDVKVVAKPAAAPAAAGKKDAAPAKADSSKAKAAPKKDAPKESKPKAEKAAPEVAPSAEGESGKENARGGSGHRRSKDGDKRKGAHAAKSDDAEGAKPRKREFDRRSATGRAPGQSRGGRGPYGFGSEQQDAYDAEKDPSSVDIIIDSAEGLEEGAEAVEEVEAEPEPVTLTLEEYMAKRNQVRSSSEILNVKTQTREVDTSLKVVSKQQFVSDFEVGAGRQSKQKAKPQRSEQTTQLVDVGFKQAPTYEREDRKDDRRPREGGNSGRGYSGGNGRGGGRGGGRGSGGSRNISKGMAGIDLSDKNAFPSL